MADATLPRFQPNLRRLSTNLSVIRLILNMRSTPKKDTDFDGSRQMSTTSGGWIASCVKKCSEAEIRDRLAFYPTCPRLHSDVEDSSKNANLKRQSMMR